MFGFMQKNVNALDLLIEDAKITLQSWGAHNPSFMLCNSKLTIQVSAERHDISVIWRQPRSSPQMPHSDIWVVHVRVFYIVVVVHVHVVANLAVALVAVPPVFLLLAL